MCRPCHRLWPTLFNIIYYVLCAITLLSTSLQPLLQSGRLGTEAAQSEGKKPSAVEGERRKKDGEKERERKRSRSNEVSIELHYNIA